MYAILLLVAWPFFLYWPVTIGKKVFSEGDILWLFLPVRTELERALAEGRLPLWTPSLQAGFPLFAEGQVAALYPLNVLFHRLLPVEFALSYTILVNLVWACLGMYFLARSSGFRVTSAFLGGMVFGASGYFAAHISHLSLVATASWLPWLILFQQKYWRARQSAEKAFPWILLACVSIGVQFFGGYPPMAFLNVGTFGLMGLFGPFLWSRLASEPPKRRIVTFLKQLPGTSLVTILLIVLGAGIAAIQLLPLAEFTGFSVRGQEVGRAFFTSYSLEPLGLIQFILPFWYLGQPNAGNMEFWSYVGVLPIILTLLAPLLRRDFRTWFFFLFGLIALFLALGGFNPLYEWLYYVPVFNRFRAPARFLFLVVFAAAFLAATAFDELQSKLLEMPQRNWKPGTVALAFVIATLGVIALAYNLPPEFWAEVWRWLPGFIVLCSILVLLVAQRHLGSRTTFSLSVVGLVVLDLAIFSTTFLTSLTRMTIPADLVQVPRTVRAMDSRQPLYRVYNNRFPSVTQAAVRATLWSFLPLVYQKEGVVTGYVPGLRLQRNELYIERMSLAMRNLINIRYYLLPLETAPQSDPSPFDASEPNGGLTLNALSEFPEIPITRVSRLEVTSYTDQSKDLPNGFVAGEIVLGLDGDSIDLPIRLGIETADWAFDGIVEKGTVDHTKPVESISFPAYLSSVGHEFAGHKYVARYAATPAPWLVKSIGVRSFLPGTGLTIERVALIDERGNTISLAALLHRNDLALVFRSHTAAMWENRDVLPRAFMIHAAEVVKDEQALAQMKQPDFRPDQVVLLSDDQAINTTTVPGQANGNDAVVVTDYKAERVVVKVNAESAGYLVLTDSWYPGWEATVDGRSVSIYRADYIFRAVRLQAGEHTIVFEYHPASFAIGAAISGLSLIICGALATLAFRRLREGGAASAA